MSLISGLFTELKGVDEFAVAEGDGASPLPSESQ
jgi:hypothetical protein